jgi:hypothetical protein
MKYNVYTQLPKLPQPPPNLGIWLTLKKVMLFPWEEENELQNEITAAPYKNTHHRSRQAESLPKCKASIKLTCCAKMCARSGHRIQTTYKCKQ